MIQVEMAGPRYPRTINLAPQDVITMANRILGTCLERGGYYGGFIALDMSVLKAWVVAEETKLDDPYREIYSSIRI